MTTNDQSDEKMQEIFENAAKRILKRMNPKAIHLMETTVKREEILEKLMQIF